MPQISQILETYASQFFWLLIVFGLIYFTIGKGMLPKIEANMDARDRKIADDLAAAERLARKPTIWAIAARPNWRRRARRIRQWRTKPRRRPPRMPRLVSPRPMPKLEKSWRRLRRN